MDASMDVIGKAIRALGSCENVLQVETAMRYARLAIYRKIRQQYEDLEFVGYACQRLEAHIRWIDYFESKKRDKEASLCGFIRRVPEQMPQHNNTDGELLRNRRLRIAPPRGTSEILRSKQLSTAR
jgi:hypothetical protein